MAYAEGQMDGSRDWRVGLNVYLVSQNMAGNFSTFYWEVSIQNPAGQGAWFSDNGTWSCSAGGSGTWNWPSSMAGARSKILGSGYFNSGHDAEGFRSGFPVTATASAPHESIGSGSVEVWVDAPRIPKRPTAARSVTASEVKNDSVRLSWLPPADNRGAPIDAYLLRYWEGASVSGPYVDHSTDLNTSRVVSGLKPGKTYTFVVYSHNGATWDWGGFGPASNIVTVILLAGVYVSDGTNWVPQALRGSNGSAWSSLVPSVSTGSDWVQPK